MDCSPLRLVSGLLHELVELDLRLRPFQSARVPHDLLVGVAAAIGLDRGLAIPFRVRDEFGSVSAAQELFRNAALLPDHERSALRLPDPCGVFGLGRIDLDVDEADDRHGVLLMRSRRRREPNRGRHRNPTNPWSDRDGDPRAHLMRIRLFWVNFCLEGSLAMRTAVWRPLCIPTSKAVQPLSMTVAASRL